MFCSVLSVLCLEWPNKMTDKLTRESHVKQLMVESMLCFSFDRPVTDNCPILVLKKKSTILEKHYQRLRAVPTWFQPRWKWFKSILILMSTKKRQIGQPEHPSCKIRVFAAWIIELWVLKRLRYCWVGSEKWSDWADTEAVIYRVTRDQTVGLTHRSIRVSLYVQAFLFDL